MDASTAKPLDLTVLEMFRELRRRAKADYSDPRDQFLWSEIERQMRLAQAMDTP